MKQTIISCSLLALVTSAACSFIARGEDQYRSDTRAMLDEQANAGVKSCYDQQLAQNPAQSGTVTLNFTVEKKTGAVTNVAVDPEQTTAPEGLQQCVVSAVEGLALKPEDRHDGQATFTWQFSGGGGAM